MILFYLIVQRLFINSFYSWKPKNWWDKIWKVLKLKEFVQNFWKLAKPSKLMQVFKSSFFPHIMLKSQDFEKNITFFQQGYVY